MKATTKRNLRTSLLLLAAAVVLFANAPGESHERAGVNAQNVVYPASNVRREG